MLNVMQVRLLVTHGIGFLPQCDYIIVISDGAITEMGTYAELIDNNGPFSQFIKTYQSVQNGTDNNQGNQMCAIIMSLAGN